MIIISIMRGVKISQVNESLQYRRRILDTGGLQPTRRWFGPEVRDGDRLLGQIVASLDYAIKKTFAINGHYKENTMNSQLFGHKLFQARDGMLLNKR